MEYVYDLLVYYLWYDWSSAVHQVKKTPDCQDFHQYPIKELSWDKSNHQITFQSQAPIQADLYWFGDHQNTLPPKTSLYFGLPDSSWQMLSSWNKNSQQLIQRTYDLADFAEYRLIIGPTEIPNLV